MSPGNTSVISKLGGKFGGNVRAFCSLVGNVPKGVESKVNGLFRVNGRTVQKFMGNLASMGVGLPRVR